METPFTLSRYFPTGTEYFYSYPTMEDSHFFNGVPPEVDELVAARPLVCCGPNLKTICFQASVEPFVWGMMEELGSLKARREDVLVLPKDIDHHLTGAERNKRVKEALVDISSPGKLVMAQPFLDFRLKDKYAIPSHRIIWLNDKRNLSSYIPKAYTPEHYDEFLDGRCFEEYADQLPLPCVIKVSSSSSGDGVHICKTEKDVEEAKRKFAGMDGMILITEFVDIQRNFSAQFGIPEDQEAAPEIILWHEQLIDKNGAFLGGIIEPMEDLSVLKPLSKVLLEKILPEVRRKGWFGVGGFDVLMDADERFTIVDPNFRMTGMSVYDLLARNGDIQSPLISFMGTFAGTQDEFQNTMRTLAKVGSPSQRLYLTSLTEHDGLFRFNAALLFGGRDELPGLAREVLGKGIQADVLSNISR